MNKSAQVTVTLEADLDAFIRDEAARGAFPSSSEYVHQVLRQRYEQDRNDRLRDLDAALDRGIADADAGRVKSIEETFNGLRKALGLDLNDV